MMTWRDCPKCHKSYDGIYRQHFGCRACHSVEPFDGQFTDLTRTVTMSPPKRKGPKLWYERKGHPLMRTA